ncbi:MAG: TraB/GumN family protein [Chromatiales bacterium]|jgi:uncharacterized protein YbaP (TraB family)
MLLYWFVWLLSLPAQAAEPFTQGLLFSINKTGYEQSYVFGTIHSGRPEVLALQPEVQQAFDEADHFVMEAVIQAPAILSSLADLWLTDGHTLQQVIGADLYQLVIETGEQQGIPAATFIYMKPWVVMVMFSMPPDNRGQILDVELMNMAKASGKTLTGLESIQQQFDVFDQLSIADQKILLAETLKNYPQLPMQFEKLLRAYQERDLGKLQQIAADSQGSSQRVKQASERAMQRLLEQRNLKMVDKMEKLIVRGKHFIAVGALHLPGDKGVLKLLEDKGFSIRRVY